MQIFELLVIASVSAGAGFTLGQILAERNNGKRRRGGDKE